MFVACRLASCSYILLTTAPISTTIKATNRDYEEYDLLIGMDVANLRNMHRICGGDFAGKLHLLMDYTKQSRDVADPWYTDDFEATWQDVLAGCQGLLRELTARRCGENG